MKMVDRRGERYGRLVVTEWAKREKGWGQLKENLRKSEDTSRKNENETTTLRKE